jgi:hypothetical protein
MGTTEDTVCDFTALLLGTLGYTDDEFVSVGHEDTAKTFRTSVMTPAGAIAAIAKPLPDGANIYFGVNPTSGPARRDAGRGTAADVTRLAALWCDLDVKPGGCVNLDIARAIVAELSIRLGTRPSVTVNSGHGLHAYWPVDAAMIGEDLTTGQARTLLRRWGRLVAAIGAEHKAHVDSVFDLPRMLRMPGSFNNKAAGNGAGPIPVTAYTDTGGPLTATEIDERLTELGICAEPEDITAETISAPETWTWAEETCGYVTAMIEAWPTDEPPGRHPWLVSQSVRLACACRLGCLTEADLDRARELLEARFTQLCAGGEPPRAPGRFEVAAAWRFGIERASAKTDEQARTELGRHVHEDDRQHNTRGEDHPGHSGVAPVDGAQPLDDIVKWLGRFIRVTDPDDLSILALWIPHTYLARELYTTPRLLIGSVIPECGKTTLLDHLKRLCCNPILAAVIGSDAMLPRLLQRAMRTVLIDEAHRSLRSDKPGVEDVLSVINTGYRFGASRPVLVPARGGGWREESMSTYAPVAIAGVSPNLPDDTLSRSIRIVLMPDLDGTVEDSDWEQIEADAKKLAARVADWANQVREQVGGLAVELPAKCIGRRKEKWRPLARIAAAAGGDWPAIADSLIISSIAEDEAEREAGLKTQPPGMVLLTDLHAVWPGSEPFLATAELTTKLINQNPDYWGADSAYGKSLTEIRLGRLLSQAAKITSCRPDHKGPRGYRRADLAPAWLRLRIAVQATFDDPPGESGPPGPSGLPGPNYSDGRAKWAESAEWAGSKRIPTEPGGGP